MTMQTHVDPPEPFAQIWPGQLIQEGDLVKLFDRGDWQPAGEDMIGQPVPERNLAVARLKLPEGWARLAPGDKVQAEDRVWCHTQPSWEPIPCEEYAGKVVEDLANHIDDSQQIIIIRQQGDPVAAEDIPVPARHRELFAGEIVRRGDRIIHDGLRDWMEVPDRLRGAEVPPPDDSAVRSLDALHGARRRTVERVNCGVRYCRAVHPQAQAWYVDLREGAGDDELGIGSQQQPFATLEGAKQRIEKAAETTFRRPYGIIWDVRGVPLAAYDLPEPEPRSPMPMIDRIIDDPLGLQHTRDAMMAEMIAKEDQRFIDAVAKAVPGPCFAEAAATLDATKRRMVGTDEEIRAGDLIYQALAGDDDLWTWQPVPGTEIGTEVGDRLISRKTAPVADSQTLQSRLEATRRKLIEAQAELDNVLEGPMGQKK